MKLHEVAAEIRPAPAPYTEAPARRIALQAVGLRKTFGTKIAVSEATFELREGEILGFLGPNGAGKTTTISMIASWLRPTSGDVSVFGHSVTREARAVRRVLGVVPQDLAIYPGLSATENLRFFGRIYGLRGRSLERRVGELLERVGLDTRATEPAESFSGGMKRRLNLAVGLVHSPKLVLLDEPTVGVDPQSRERIFSVVESLRDEGAAILYTTHYMEEAERLCDRLAILDDGRIIAHGTLAELLSSADGHDVIELSGMPRGADLRALRAAPGAVRLEVRGARARLFVERSARALGAVDRAIRRLGPSVRLTVSSPSLESLFLELTGKELRDE